MVPIFYRYHTDIKPILYKYRYDTSGINIDMKTSIEKPWDITIPDDIRRIASENRRYIFRMLLDIKDDTALIGHIITKIAKENDLISQDKAKIKGKTIQEWINSFEVDGRNTPNAWACRAGVLMLLSNKTTLKFENREAYLTVLYYMNPENDLEILKKSKMKLDEFLLSIIK